MLTESVWFYCINQRAATCSAEQLIERRIGSVLECAMCDCKALFTLSHFHFTYSGFGNSRRSVATAGSRRFAQPTENIIKMNAQLVSAVRHKVFTTCCRTTTGGTTATALNPRIRLQQRAAFSTGAIRPSAVRKVCIVGAGPAGFYAAQYLVKHLTDVQVDIVEKLPVPFGLVR